MVDDTADQFSQGTPSGTVVRSLTGGDGAVELARTLDEQFDGAALPVGWSSTPWSPGGAATVAGGSLVVDGARADSGVSPGPGSSLEFVATLGTQAYAHVGFATDFNSEPWAMFSTGAAGGGKVYARTSDAGGPAVDADFLIPVADATARHTYRIDWTTTGFDYYVDGAPVVSHPVGLTAAMRAQASDYSPDAAGISVDSMILSTHKPTGTLTSRTLDAGDSRVTALSFAATSLTPGGTAVAYETRTGTSPAALASATWAPLGAGSAVTSPAARYLQYRATLSTPAAADTPRLERVDVGFTVDDRAPIVTIDDVAVSGGTAKVTFSSDDPAAVVKCKLDGAAFANCTSPAEFSGLAAGSHAVVVQATDAQGNVGSATETIDVDTLAPTVAISDVAVSGGTARVTFSSDDPSAVVKCKLDGAASASCTSPAEFSGLAAGSHAVVVQATDAQGNVGSATRTFDVATPTGGSGTTPPPAGGGTTPDLTAPKVRVTQRSVRVSKHGTAGVRVKCPLTEVRCTVTVKLKLGGKTVARKTLTLSGGTTRALGLRLSKATRLTLAARSKLEVTAVVTARDAAGNRRTTQLRMTLRAPSY